MEYPRGKGHDFVPKKQNEPADECEIQRAAAAGHDEREEPLPPAADGNAQRKQGGSADEPKESVQQNRHRA